MKHKTKKQQEEIDRFIAREKADGDNAIFKALVILVIWIVALFLILPLIIRILFGIKCVALYIIILIVFITCYLIKDSR